MFVFFFNDTATTEIYTLSLHDALPIYGTPLRGVQSRGHHAHRTREEHRVEDRTRRPQPQRIESGRDRKSTRLNSSHANTSYAVFCLKKKKKTSLQHRNHIGTTAIAQYY